MEPNQDPNMNAHFDHNFDPCQNAANWVQQHTHFVQTEQPTSTMLLDDAYPPGPSSRQPIPPQAQMAMYHQNVYNWQNADIVRDSGFQSGGTSAAPSVISARSSLRGGLLDNSMTEAMQATSTNYLSQNMFPEIGSGDYQQQAAGEQMYPDQSMASPHQGAMQRLENGVSNMRMNPHSVTAEQLGTILPDAVDLLKDNDQETVYKATEFVFSLLGSFRKLALSVMVQHPALVDAVVAVLNNPAYNEKTIYYGMGFLHALSEYDEGQILIMQCNAIPTIVNMLALQHDQLRHTCSVDRRCSFQQILNYTVITLHNILQNGRQLNARTIAYQHQVVEKLSALYRTANERFLVFVSDSLFYILHKNSAAKDTFLRCGGTCAAVQLLMTATYESCLRSTTRVLKAIATDRQNKQKLVFEYGVLAALAKNLDHESEKLLTYTLTTILNLSDLVNPKPVPDHPPQTPVQLPGVDTILWRCNQHLGSTNFPVVQTCARIMANLTANNPYYKQLLVQANAPYSLCRVISSLMQMHVQSVEDQAYRVQLCDDCLLALKNLTYGHEEARQVALLIADNPALGPRCMVKLLSSMHFVLASHVLLIIKNMMAAFGNSQEDVQLRERVRQNLKQTRDEQSGRDILNICYQYSQNTELAIEEAQLVGRKPEECFKDGIRCTDFLRRVRECITYLNEPFTPTQ